VVGTGAFGVCFADWEDLMLAKSRLRIEKLTEDLWIWMWIWIGSRSNLESK